ncbi:unnamed protein product [Penicillium egyptiacum]|uniref:RING-type domain-containing protein n=1 Tax=Penicillium egyptiacum TaxID=1303716 RepID=A0A9W4P6D1_9EURO|nr:unnamed protein product [Penicillium egyptiacum]
MDPVSLTATVAGLILFVKDVKQLSEKIYSTVKSKPHLVRKIADDLAALEIVLERLGQHSNDDGKDGEQEALSKIISACQKAVSEIFTELSVLHDGFSKGVLRRVFSYSKFKAQMETLSELRTELAAFKLTLGLALQVRTMDRIPESATVILEEIRLQLKKARPVSLWTHPIQQYVEASSSFITPQTQDNANFDDLDSDASSTEGSCGMNNSEQGSEDYDMANVTSFESFDSWLASFGVPANTLSPYLPSTDQVNKDGWTRPASSLLDTFILSTVELNVQNLQGSDPSNGCALPSEQKISLAPLDPLWKAVQEIQDRGYSDVCGFRFRDHLLAPIAPLNAAVPLYVSDGPSIYTVKQGLRINQNQPLEQFYETLARSGKPKRRPRITACNGRIRVEDEEMSQPMEVSLNRTLRVPEDGTTYNLPMWVGEFPIVETSALRDKLPSTMAERGGLVVPMYQREALSIGFHGSHNASHAVKILSGGANAISGSQEGKGTVSSIQDYTVAPAQHRIDGFFPQAGISIVGQFVSMPLGGGYSVEEQLTGKANIGGIQMIVAPRFTQRGIFQEGSGRRNIPAAEQSKSPFELGLSNSSCLLISGDKITEHHRQSKHEQNILCVDESFGLRFVVQSYPPRQEIVRRHPDTERAVLLHETMAPFLTELKHLESVPLEPILKYTITITTVHTSVFRPAQGYQDIGTHPTSFGFRPDSRHDATPKALTWRVSPFMSNVHLFRLVAQELKYLEIALFYNNEQLQGLGKGRDVPHAYLYNFLHDGASVACQGYEYIPGHSAVPLSASSRTRAESKGWELGLATGGTIFQDIYVDEHPEAWNWTAASFFNIQILNSVAWKAVTGQQTPGVPPTFKDYLNARIPFYHLYHVVENQRGVSNRVLPNVRSVSEIDREITIGPQQNLSGGSPVICIFCEKNLADTIMRPCNHIFCKPCIDEHMTTRATSFCSACLRPVQRLISFSASMEAPFNASDATEPDTYLHTNMKQPETQSNRSSDNDSEYFTAEDSSEEDSDPLSEHTIRLKSYWSKYSLNLPRCYDRIQQWWQGSFVPCNLEPKVLQNISALVFLTLSHLTKSGGVKLSDGRFSVCCWTDWLSYRIEMMEILLPELDFDNVTDDHLGDFLRCSPGVDREANEEGPGWSWNHEETRYQLAQDGDEGGGHGVKGNSYDSIHRRLGILLLRAATELNSRGQSSPEPRDWVHRMTNIYNDVIRLAKGPLAPYAVKLILQFAIEHEKFFILDMVIQSYETPSLLTAIISGAIGDNGRKSHLRAYLVRRYRFQLPELNPQKGKPVPWAVTRQLYESLDVQYMPVDMTTNVAWDESQCPMLEEKQRQWQKLSKQWEATFPGHASRQHLVQFM